MIAVREWEITFAAVTFTVPARSREAALVLAGIEAAHKGLTSFDVDQVTTREIFPVTSASVASAFALAFGGITQ